VKQAKRAAILKIFSLFRIRLAKNIADTYYEKFGETAKY
jgi:hypothetical protein